MYSYMIVQSETARDEYGTFDCQSVTRSAWQACVLVARGVFHWKERTYSRWNQSNHQGRDADRMLSVTLVTCVSLTVVVTRMVAAEVSCWKPI